jgi:hypothetical protein
MINLYLGQIETILLSIGIVILCVFLFIGIYLPNKRTKKPEGCEDLTSQCEGCKVLTCGHNPVNKKDDLKEKEKNND